LGEQLLEEIGSDFGTRGGDDSRERGIAAEQSWLTSIGVDTTTLTIADGSGVSLYDRLTPRTLTAVLAADWQSDGRQTVLDALPLSGERGTLKSTFAADPLRGAIFAKTGTDYHGRLLAGYAKTARGGTVIFALMINNWMDASDGAQGALDAARAGVLQALVAS
jgi:D-alanyl-D-alanine carboxypeptidase/D-alanyl-D-alanine-endopeptidase (penicillin-binding protein 4)